MAIETLDQEICTGCGICAGVCPEDVFRMTETGKASIRYPEDCVACLVCEFVCPVNCISASLERAYPLPSPL